MTDPDVEQLRELRAEDLVAAPDELTDPTRPNAPEPNAPEANAPTPAMPPS